MRLTDAGTTLTRLTSIQDTAQRLAAAQAQASSLQRITVPSDDPAGAATALDLRSRQARESQYSGARDDATAWLSRTDSALGGAVDALQKARDLVLQGSSDGAPDASSGAALAQAIQGARTSLLGFANTTVGDRPLFGGATAGASAFAADGTYTGDATAITRVVAAGTTVTVARPGDQVFGSGTASVFAVLDRAAGQVAAGDTAGARASLDDIDTALRRLSAAQTGAGLTADRVDQLSASGSDESDQLTASLTALTQVDMPSAAIALSSANLAYQASLAAAAKTGQVSLLDYLR